MLAKLADELPVGDYLYEPKWDGFRAIVFRGEDDVYLQSRDSRPLDRYFPDLHDALLERLPKNCVVDGEIVVVDNHGQAHFEWLQGYGDKLKDINGSLQYHLFDILWCDGRDVTGMPLSERKELLRSIIPGSEVLKYSDHVEGNGLKFYEAVKKQALEGMVAKRADSPYQPGIRGLDSILAEGIPRGNVILLEGAIGTGKTTLGVEFVYRGASEYGEPGIIVIFVCSARGPRWKSIRRRHQPWSSM